MDTIAVEVIINSDIETVWLKWTKAEHIKQWYFASEDWWVPWVEQNLEIGKHFIYRMEAKDESVGFDFAGEFTQIEQNTCIVYVLEDQRKVTTTFEIGRDGVLVRQVFDVEDTLSADLQQQGWQAILNQFKKYVEQA